MVERRGFYIVLLQLVILLAGYKNILAEESRVVEEIQLPEDISSPGEVRLDGKGNVWFTEKVGKSIVLYEPEKNVFQPYRIPEEWGNVGPEKFTIAGDGVIWFSVRRWAEDVERTDFLGRLLPESGEFKRYDLPGGHVPEEIVVDGDGVVWFIDVNENELCSFEPESLRLEVFTIPTPNAYPRGLTIDGSGNIWFAEANGNKIVRFVAKERRFEEYEIPTPLFNPVAVSVDDSGRVWFAGLSANKIGVFYPERKVFNELIIPTPRGLPNSLGIDGDGNVWFVEYLGNKVGRFDPRSARIDEYDIPTFNSLPGSIAVDKTRGYVWFAETSTEAKRLGRVDIKRINDAIEETTPVAQKIEDAEGGKKGGWVFVALGVVIIGIAVYLYSTRKKAAR